MDEEILAVEGSPLVFGIQCPWCDSEHVVAALGTKVKTEDGDDIDYEPTIGLIDIEGDTDLGTIICWECHRTFQFHFKVIIPDEMFEEPIN